MLFLLSPVSCLLSPISCLLSPISYLQSLICLRLIPGGQLRALVPPLRLLVDRIIGELAQRADHPAIDADQVRRHARAGRLVHKRHKLIGEAGHGAADTDAADVWATPDAGHPAPFRNIAVDNRPPAAQLHDALGRAVLSGEIALLVVAGAVAAFVDGLAE